ncbi:MAG: nucleoside-diphosphate sugar epimerase/dehydratase [Marinilabiliales bacterium]
MKIAIPFVIIIRALSFIIARTYSGIIRFTSTKDAEKIFLAVLTGTIIIVFANFIRYYLFDHKYIVPFSVIIIDFITTAFTLTAFRLAIKILFIGISHSGKDKINILIYGTDELATITKRTVEHDHDNNYNVLGFIDDYSVKSHSTLEGIPIYHIDELEHLLKSENIVKLIISKQNIKPDIKNRIVDYCLNNDVQVLNVPEVNSWINGELSFRQIKNFKIEDLLGREPIKLSVENIRKDVFQKTVLITGGAGSIGSEIARQIIKFNPAKVILYDQSETPLYDIEIELSEKLHYKNFEVAIGDITNEHRVDLLFRTFKPQIVYHAAAYKHVPLMENNPAEAVLVNIKGTKVVADTASKYGTEKFIMISTDKAVNPTNVMGASKRIAEIYTQIVNQRSKTNYVITRFGNVLGSNGSVIPRFRKQIESGGPITITHPEVTRYFMTIPEACQLVLEAGSMGKGGEIFLFDMGKSVKILDLAKKMIKLSGLQLGKDIQIVYTGLRPGEKLFEELLCDAENTLPTHHPQIMIGKPQENSFENLEEKINKLIDGIFILNNMEMVKLMKEIVPEYKSQNSIYETLD